MSISSMGDGHWPWILLLAGLIGCDRPAEGDASTHRATATSGAEGAAPEESVITVDDTIPEPAAPDPVDRSPERGGDDPEDACAPPEADLKRMRLLRFVFATGVEGRDPADRLHVARPGRRVYAHLTVRNRSERKRCLRLVFRVGGDERTEVTLEVGKSWSWRTWAYNTIKAGDRGMLELEVTDDQGELMLKQRLPIVPE